MEPPFFAISKRTNELVLVTAFSQLLGRYFVVELFTEQDYPAEPFDITILSNDFTIVLSGRTVQNPSCSFPPFLVAEKSTGDIFLAIKTMDHAMICLKTSGKNQVGRCYHRSFRLMEILPANFLVAIKQSDILNVSE